MSRTTHTLNLVAGLLTLSAMNVQADSLIELDHQVITSTGLISEVDDSAIRTEVISAQQLEFMQAKVLTDALQYSTGLKVHKTVKQGSKISIQGIDANYILVLKDGLPFISPTGSETDLSQISLAGIERIEIIKGSGSALYGSSAMGGVINLISRESDINILELDIVQGQHETGTTDSLQEHSLYASQQWGNQRFSLLGFQKLSPEIMLDKDSGKVDGASQTLQNVELRLDHYHRAGWLTTNQSQSYMRFNYLLDEKNQRLGTLIIPGQGEFEQEYNTDSKKMSLDLGVRRLDAHLLGQGSIISRYEHYEEQSGNRDELSKDNKQRKVETQLFKIESQFNNQFQAFSSQNILSYGTSLQRNTMDQVKIETGDEEVDDKSTSTLEAYIQNDIITANLGEFVPGLRVQEDSDFGFHSNLKMNWMKEVGSFNDYHSKLRLSYGQGYRTPDLKQRFYLFDHSNLGYIIIGNESLQPEESHNLNATFTVRHHDSRFEVSAFRNQYKNKIETTSIGAVNQIQQFEYTNVGRAITQGADLSLIIQPSAQLYWQQGLMYLETENLDTGERLERQPLWGYKTQFNYSYNQHLVFSLYGSLERDSYKGTYEDNNNNDAVTPRLTTKDLIQIWDLKTSYRINNNIKLNASIDNLLNETRSAGLDANIEVDDRPVESRLLTLGLNLTF